MIKLKVMALYLIVISSLNAESINSIKQAGNYLSPDKKCTAELKIVQLGGFLQLNLRDEFKRFNHIANDITGLAWITRDSLIFSTSPVYGKPGVFIVTCQHPPKIATIVKPTNIDDSYPDGADYFELRSITDSHIRYYYGFDVDNIDFTHFRADQNLREAILPELNK